MIEFGSDLADHIWEDLVLDARANSGVKFTKNKNKHTLEIG